MHFEDASKKQLLQIALYEKCSIDDKYAAVRELQLRQWRDEYTKDLVRLWGKGMAIFNIAIELGIDEYQVKSKLKQFGLYGKRVTA